VVALLVGCLAAALAELAAAALLFDPQPTLARAAANAPTASAAIDLSRARGFTAEGRLSMRIAKQPRPKTV
jgi:hypothetical protein